MSHATQLPERLTDHIEIKHGFAFSSEFFGADGDYILLTPRNFAEAGGFRDLGAAQKRFSGPIPPSFILKKGDVLIAMTEQSPGLLGATIKVPESDVYLHNQRLGLLSVRNPARVCLTYLYHMFNAPHVRKEISASAAGTKVKHTSPTKLSAVEVFLPALADQERTAHLLDEWDTAIQKTEQLIAAKERHYSHELSRLISRGQHPHAHVGAFAEEASARTRGGQWRAVSLSDIATVWKGQQLNKDAMVEDGAYYALNGGIKPSGRTTEWNCEAGTVTVSSGGNSCGFIRLNYERFWCGGDCFALKKLSPDVDVSYLFYYLKCQQHRMMALRTGSGIPHVYRADVEAFPVALPDLATQTAIARYLNALREEIDLLGRSAAALKTQKRGLMQKLLTGQWRLSPSKEMPR